MKSMLLAALTAVSCGVAHAQLTSRNFSAVGDNRLTYDSSTGYEWLDLSVTRGMTLATVQSNIALGGSLEGFHIATHSEFYYLLQFAGIPMNPGSETYTVGDPYQAEVFDFQSRFGYYFTTARTGNNSYITEGYLDSGYGGRVYYDDSIYGLDLLRTGSSIHLPNPDVNTGYFLVRATDTSAVPEPSTYGLMGAAALLGLIAWRRRKSAGV